MWMKISGALSLFGAVILLTILVAQILEKRKNGSMPAGDSFRQLLASAFLLLLLHALLMFRRLSFGDADAVPVLIGIACCLNLVYALYCRYICLLMEYCKTGEVILRSISGPVWDRGFRRMLHFQYACCGFCSIMLIWGILSTDLNEVLICVSIIMTVEAATLMYNLIRYRKMIGRYYSLVLAVITPLPLFAGGLEILIHDVQLVFLTITLILLILYIMIQTSQARVMMEAVRITERNRLQLVAGRLKPHFLFNSLTTIYYLCEQDPALAQRAIENFSSYLRQTMDSFDSEETVPFSWERDQIDHYMFLEKLRFGDRISLRYELGEEEFRLPPLSLQLLVENAVKHGPDSEHPRVEIVISSERSRIDAENSAFGEQRDGILVKVSDNGRGFDPAKLTSEEMNSHNPNASDEDRVHLGLKTAEERIRLLCGGSMTVDSAPGQGTAVTLFIPDKDAPAGR